jgi:hypothetical protein
MRPTGSSRWLRVALLWQAWPGRIDAQVWPQASGRFPPKLRELFVYRPCRAYLYGPRRIAWARVADLPLT